MFNKHYEYLNLHVAIRTNAFAFLDAIPQSILHKCINKHVIYGICTRGQEEMMQYLQNRGYTPSNRTLKYVTMRLHKEGMLEYEKN